MSADTILRTAAALALALLVAYAGRLAARALRQPEVIGEITGGLLIGPLIIALAGRGGLATLFGPPVLGVLRLLGQIGLVLFLVQVAHELRRSADRSRVRAAGWVAAGAFLPALAAGLAFAGILMAGGDPGLRGHAPAPAFLLLVAVSLTVTAVPVLARILADRGMLGSLPGTLSMSAAVVIDAITWPILAVAIGLSTGRMSGALVALAVLAIGLGVALVLARLLAGRSVARYSRLVAVGIAVVAFGAAETTERFGVTTIFGAFLIGLAIPADGGWDRAVGRLSWASSKLMPIFFVVTGVLVFTAPLGSLPWLIIPLVLVLAMAGKIGGGYLGARLGGHPPPVGARIGILMNTRGLTEIIVLQAGFSAGVLPPALYLVLLVMALVTTALTGPLLSWMARREARSPVEAA